ncbi:MAG: hypothetical protein WDO14_11860 [Bacteroidota bacterium]
MRKVFILLAFFLITAANTAVISVINDNDRDDIEMPIEEDKDIAEDDDDEFSIDHLWISRDKTSDSNLHILYQEILFNDLDIEVIVPPPKA